MSKELTIIRQENIQTILSVAPQSYMDNKLSREKCESAGLTILDAIVHGGMTDELDQRAAQYIEKTRKTVKKMNERRMPVTQLFDVIRKEFTAMENAIDPIKADTIPFKILQYRNQYAAKKLAEEQERRRKEYERQQAEAARARLRQDIEEDFKQQFHILVNKKCNELSELDNSITLDNYDASYKRINDYPASFPIEFLTSMHTSIRIPVGISTEELHNTEVLVKECLAKQFTEQYEFEVDSTKQYIVDRLPSKKANLERMAKASAEEAARIKAEMEERRRKEAAEQEAERKRKEEEQTKMAELARQQSEMENLFGEQAVIQNYQPKVKVTQKINLVNPEGIMPILSMWWSKEGCHLSVDELAKMFKKQITFCEKIAKEGIYISDESVEYVEDIKAK